MTKLFLKKSVYGAFGHNSYMRRAFLCPQVCQAQFYSVERSTEPLIINKEKRLQTTEIDRISVISDKNITSVETSTEVKTLNIEKTSHGKNGGVKTLSRVNERTDLPELTIPNLLAEIKKNGIQYPKVVLAQAILETGWFKSSVCRNKHNLFGLTNPRTKDYYEFNHWTESVKAYYTKVQYRYKGGNYLLWLKKIGYAEDPGYIRAIIRVLRQL